MVFLMIDRGSRIDDSIRRAVELVFLPPRPMTVDVRFVLCSGGEHPASAFGAVEASRGPSTWLMKATVNRGDWAKKRIKLS